MTCVIVYAFAYSVDTKLGLPYEIYMTLLIVSSYTFMIDYLLLPSEYMEEWALLWKETKRNIYSYESFVLSTMLTDTPRGVLHCILTLTITYTIRGLNPDPTNIVFSITCLMIGVNAWQGVICMCAMVSNHIAVMHLLIFLLLGGGTLFGGLLVSYSNIPFVAKPLYHLSVTAVTQRALVVNDFLCCYLTYSCEDTATDVLDNERLHLPDTVIRINDTNTVTSHEFMKDSAQMCPDGFSEGKGNLGRFALQELELSDVDNYISLFTLFCVAVGARIGAICVLW